MMGRVLDMRGIWHGSRERELLLPWRFDFITSVVVVGAKHTPDFRVPTLGT